MCSWALKWKVDVVPTVLQDETMNFPQLQRNGHYCFGKLFQPLGMASALLTYQYNFTQPDYFYMEKIQDLQKGSACAWSVQFITLLLVYSFIYDLCIFSVILQMETLLLNMLLPLYVCQHNHLHLDTGNMEQINRQQALCKFLLQGLLFTKTAGSNDCQRHRGMCQRP